MSPEIFSRALKLRGDRSNNQAAERKPADSSLVASFVQSGPNITARLQGCRCKPRDFDRSRSIIGGNQMKHLVLTFLSTATVCAVLSAPAAAQDTVTGAPVGE